MILQNLIVKGVCKILQNPKINELVADKVNGVTKEEIHSLDGITGNVQNFMNDVNTELDNIGMERDSFKQEIANSVNKKNGEANLTKDSKLSDFTTKIEDIETGKDVSAVTAVAGDVLAGKVIVDKDGNQVTGTIPKKISSRTTVARFQNRENDKYVTLNNFPVGYYFAEDGKSWTPEVQISTKDLFSGIGLGAAQIIKGKSVCDLEGNATSDATATAAQILSGKTAYVNGVRLSGTMPSKNGSSKAIHCATGSGGLYMVFPYGYYPAESHFSQANSSEVYSSLASVASALGISANKIMSGNTICGISGTGGGKINKTWLDNSSFLTAIPNNGYFTLVMTNYISIPSNALTVNAKIRVHTSNSQAGTFLVVYFNRQGSLVSGWGNVYIISSSYGGSFALSPGSDYNNYDGVFPNSFIIYNRSGKTIYLTGLEMCVTTI